MSLDELGTYWLENCLPFLLEKVCRRARKALRHISGTHAVFFILPKWDIEKSDDIWKKLSEII